MLQIREKERKKHKIHLFVYSFSACFFFFFSEAHLNSAALKTDLFILFNACFPLVCLLLILMGFLFCITRTNLIRAEGIQIRVHPPNPIWFPNKGLGERKDGITSAFQEPESKLLENCESFNK